jgi:hypothetical protein
MRTVDAPKGFDSEVLGSGWIADEANDPTVDFALMPTEQRLEGVEVAVTELPQHVRWLFQHWHLLPFYIRLRHGGAEGYREVIIATLEIGLKPSGVYSSRRANTT